MSEQETNKKICPLTQKECLEEQCAWYVSKIILYAYTEDETIKACAVQLIGENIDAISE